MVESIFEGNRYKNAVVHGIQLKHVLLQKHQKKNESQNVAISRLFRLNIINILVKQP